MSSDVSNKEYNISHTALRSTIYQKITEFRTKYKVHPQFMKIPVWVYQYVKVLPDCICIDGGGATQETFFGLVLCPTISIENLDDIEVF